MKTRTENIISLFKGRFVHRYDCYPQQYTNNGGGYALRKKILTDQIILSHLKGEKTIGLYGSPQSTTKWICIDIDTTEPAAVREVQNHARRFNIPYLTEFSGQKGYHIWTFFHQSYPNKIARTLANAYSCGHEVFPKQDHIQLGKIGNLVKAPLGKHQLTNRWCTFLDKNLEPEKNQYATLENTSTLNPIEVLQTHMPEAWNTINDKSNNKKEDHTPKEIIKIPILKDCIQNAIQTGTTKGKRNQTAHIIATELRNTGITKAHTSILLETIWNMRNNPPLNTNELQTIINSAYKGNKYVYGCKADGLLRLNIPCKGPENCQYFSFLKAIRENH